MKFHADPQQGNSIEASGDGWIKIAGQIHHENLLLTHNGDLTPWSVTRLESLDASAFEALCISDIELVILGTGLKHRFLRPSAYHPLIQQGIGLETMSSAAACRTYNVLISEGRKVLLALIQEN